MLALRIVMYLVPMVLSLSVHEFAHAFVAWRFGDDTAKRQGRLTLNPIAHVDPFGTLLIPAIAAFSGGVPLLGWARPVPVDLRRLRPGVDVRRAHMLISAAGPLSNLLLAILSVAVYAFGGHAIHEQRGIVMLLDAMFAMNVGLFVFNLLPIPPLDGSRLLPRSFDGYQRKVAPYGMFVLMALLFVPSVQHFLIQVPIEFVKGAILAAFRLG